MKVSPFERGVNYVVLTLFALYALAPILTIFLTALRPQSGVQGGGLHLENFVDAWRIGNFGTALGNSVLVAVLVVSVAVVLSILAGYAFGTMRFRGSTVLFKTLDANEIGMQLTESLAMFPASSVSGFYLGHPDSTYFNVGQIGEDQVEDMAVRRGMDVEALRRALAPNLG